MSGDLSRVDQWIYQVLSRDNLLSNMVGSRIYGDAAPQNVTLPLVLFSFLGGADKIQTLRSRLTNAIYLIRAVGSGSSYDAIEALADRIDAVLFVPEQGVQQRDIRIASCSREQPHQRKDFENGIPTVYLGGFYRIRYQPTAI